MRVVGRDLAQTILRPFEHLRLSASPLARPRLTIDLWDASLTRVPGPDAVGGSDARLWQMVDGVIGASADGRFVAYRQLGGATWLDRAALAKV